MNHSQSLDLVVFGATGFTGRLVAEYLHTTYGNGRAVRWAMAGRSQPRLAQVRKALGIDTEVPLLVADAHDSQALTALVRQARVVISTVGPYQLHGQALATACAQTGTDYVDLCGEPVWMAQMVPLLQPLASASGARIVFSCGFDSIPFDLGVLFLQHEAQQRWGTPMNRVHGRVKQLQGGWSGGTVASAMASIEAIRRNPTGAKTWANPFALTPGFQGPAQPDVRRAEFDEWLGQWTAPFVMAPINTKNVHRTHALLGHCWGTDFVYSERLLTGAGAPGRARARRQVRKAWLHHALVGWAPMRALLRRWVLPQPGQGPSREQREKGHYEIAFVGQTADGRRLSASVHGDRDPGYASTCKLVTEAALCLALETDRVRTPGGVWTPGAAMGMALVRRLQARAGLGFAVTP